MGKKIVFLITEDWFFESHFLERAMAAVDAGHHVYVATKVTRTVRPYWCEKISLIPIDFQRSGINAFRDLLTIFTIARIYRAIAPDIVHQIALKPIIYGTLARHISLLRVKVVNAPVGMGYVFTSTETRAALLRPLVLTLLRLTLNPQNSKVVFENPDDLAEAVSNSIVARNDAVLIQGAGVDIRKYAPRPSGNVTPIISLVARMLVDKGVRDFVEAARIVNKERSVAIFNLIGDPDPSNPASLTKEWLERNSGKNGIFWLGFSSDISEIYKSSDIACLPSYREGLPKSLIEAAACGLPIVATDAVGCREVVVHGLNGYLVPVRSPGALAEAILRLVNDSELRRSMGVESRRLAVTKFASEIVVNSTLSLYADEPS